MKTIFDELKETNVLPQSKMIVLENDMVKEPDDTALSLDERVAKSITTHTGYVIDEIQSIAYIIKNFTREELLSLIDRHPEYLPPYYAGIIVSAFPNKLKVVEWLLMNNNQILTKYFSHKRNRYGCTYFFDGADVRRIHDTYCKGVDIDYGELAHIITKTKAIDYYKSLLLDKIFLDTYRGNPMAYKVEVEDSEVLTKDQKEQVSKYLDFIGEYLKHTRRNDDLEIKSTKENQDIIALGNLYDWDLEKMKKRLNFNF